MRPRDRRLELALEYTMERDPTAGIATFRPRGTISLWGMLELREALAAALRNGYARHLLDLSAVWHINAKSLGILVERRDRAREAGGQLVLVAPAGPLRDLLAAAGTYATFAVAVTEAEGRALLSPAGVAAG